MTSFLFCNYAHPADIHFQRAERRKRHSWSGKKILFPTTQHITQHGAKVFSIYVLQGNTYKQHMYWETFLHKYLIEVPIHKMQIITSFTMLFGIQKESIFLRTWCSTKVDTQSIIALSIITIDSFIYSLEWLCYSVKITGRSFEMSPRNSLLLP